MASSLWLLLFLQINYVFCQLRPFYLSAHTINGKDQVAPALNEGANGIEMDVRFQKDGTVYRTYHGGPCTRPVCTAETEIGEMLGHLRDLGNEDLPNSIKDFTHIQLDLKLTQDLELDAVPKAGMSVAEKLMQHYWTKDTKPESLPCVILQIEYTKQKEFITAFLKYLEVNNFSYVKPRLGFEFSEEQDIPHIMETFRSLHVHHNIWQGDGYTNKNNAIRNTTRLEEAIRVRDTGNNSKVGKVYGWTINMEVNMKAYLERGVDGLLTDEISKVRSVMQNYKYRMATRKDNCWQRFANDV